MRNQVLCRVCSPQPLDVRTIVILLVYVCFFGIALRYFLLGHHIRAYLVLFAAFLSLVGYVIRRDLRRDFQG
jgi:hypothetical protein